MGRCRPAGRRFAAPTEHQSARLRAGNSGRHDPTGSPVRVSVDGISEPLSGTVSYISPKAEYTPPVIYSQESRNKLVFMVEAVFAPDVAANLHPGQPVDVGFGSAR